MVPDDALTVRVSADELGAALDVLVDNVFSHTPDRTPFALAVQTEGKDVIRVIVEDDGPGFATVDPAERGRSGTGSTGLGLDVARRTAGQAGGHLLLSSSAAGGARVILELPAA